MTRGMTEVPERDSNAMKEPPELELSDDEEGVSVPPGTRELASSDEEGTSFTHAGWEGGSHKPRLAPAQEEASSHACHKEAGNAAMKAGRFQEALEHYARGLAAAGSDARATATLHSNIAAVHMRTGAYLKALTAAQRAAAQDPTWWKPALRSAQANLKLARWAAAAAAAEQGRALAPSAESGAFAALLDDIAVQAYLRGSLAGFPGTCLHVRSAGDEAWLGGPAPYDPQLDGPEAVDPGQVVKYLPSAAGLKGEAALGAVVPLGPDGAPLQAGPAPDRLVTWQAQHAQRRTSFRSLKEAMLAAEDGDRILLGSGTHNGMGEAIVVDKRVLIQGQGQLGEVVIDQRSNTPTFRIQSPGAVIHNLVLDQTGFKETVLVGAKGPTDPWRRAGAAALPSQGPLLLGCSIKSSGDDGVNLSGTARATLQHCTISAKKSGVRVFGAARATLVGCTLENCFETAVKLMDKGHAELIRCHISDSAEDGIVVMDSASVSAVETEICGCKGPALDASDAGQARLVACRARDCQGGAWAWDRAALHLRDCVLEGGATHTLVLHGAESRGDIKGCTITGSVVAADDQSRLVIQQENTVLPVQRHIGWPMEDGPFRFVPNPYTRKQ